MYVCECSRRWRGTIKRFDLVKWKDITRYVCERCKLQKGENARWEETGMTIGISRQDWRRFVDDHWYLCCIVHVYACTEDRRMHFLVHKPSAIWTSPRAECHRVGRAAAQRQRRSPSRADGALNFYDFTEIRYTRFLERSTPLCWASRLTTSIWVERRRVNATSVLIGLKNGIANRSLMNLEL